MKGVFVTREDTGFGSTIYINSYNLKNNNTNIIIDTTVLTAIKT
jgi:hypothetical protein